MKLQDFSSLEVSSHAKRKSKVSTQEQSNKDMFGGGDRQYWTVTQKACGSCYKYMYNN